MGWTKVALLAAVGAGAVGCSNEGAACLKTDLCAQIPVARVTAVCGTSAISASEDGSMGGPSFTGCRYSGAAGDAFLIGRTCYESAAETASLYASAHSQGPDFVTAEISGLGNSAFFRFNEPAMLAQVYVLSVNRFIVLTDMEATDAASAQACMTALARDAIAAP